MKATLKLSILFVDDDPLDRTRFVETMAAANSPHDVFLAATVTEARALREFAACDVVICRDRLPDGVAFDLLERDSSRVAILIVAPGNEAVAAEGASFGVRDYVVRDEVRNRLSELPWRIEFLFRRELARQAHRFVQQAIDALPDQVAILDDRATIIAVNAAWRRFSEFGAGAGTCCSVGDNYLAVRGADVPGEDAREAQAIAACIGQWMKDQHGEFRSELCATTPEGRKWFQLRGTRFHDADKLFLVLVLEDISEVRAAAEEVRHLNENLERRVMARTAQLDAANRELRREIAERQRLEREVVKVSESEQERLGQDLHDDLGQQLSGIAMLSSVLEASLRAEEHAKTEAAARLAALLREAVRATRDLARGLFPVDLQHGGLILTLTELAQRTEALCGVHCEIRHKRAFRYEETQAIHLYRIAQEALNNAIRHGHAHNVIIECTTLDGIPALIVTDDGIGFKTPKRKWSGIGLHLYRYRARAIGAHIKVARGENGGCKVVCLLKRPASGRTDGWRERSSRKPDSRLVPD
ncbi:MAG TPA: histidine kinase [Chthoniobacteraceae bacterium]|nr:histidine kinase [Chthoniobacteraceae bacterium]